MRKMLTHEQIHPTLRSDQFLPFRYVAEVETAVEQNRIVVVGMRWNDARGKRAKT